MVYDHLYMLLDLVKFCWEFASICKTFFDTNCKNVLLGQSPKAIEIKTKINQWDLIKLRSFCTKKETNKQKKKKWKDNLQNGRKIAQTMQPKSALSPKYTNNSYNSTTKNKQPNQKWAENLNGNFSKDIQISSKHMKRCSTSLIIRETHLTLVRTAIINKSTNNKYYRGCGEKETLLHYWWECKLV